MTLDLELTKFGCIPADDNSLGKVFLWICLLQLCGSAALFCGDGIS